MISTIDQEQENLWASVETLSTINTEQAEAVLKTTVERSLRQMGFTTPAISSLALKITDPQTVIELHQIERKIKHQLKNKNREMAYELLIDYLSKLSEMTDKDPAVIQKKLIASLMANSAKSPLRASLVNRPASHQKTGNSFYSPSEAAEKIGLSDQTIRRMCEKGKFAGAFKTDGGHWRIPKANFITTDEQDKRAKAFFDRIDTKNEEAGNVDEFDL
ncbi:MULTISPECIES: helix-turn-helix domain-containing protein [unclassified Planococcus (in: firmicutes)]|uniref:helix-turn-helix domain-containing protein n=1 Tax=Planococcus TaxID=1372 RepID=UPI000C32CABC|nr:MULTISPECIES: helix-turn-helix domain-containing protein [unclassified Planococcus (in: firmicutes)]AUD14464.1 excisionase [Planococcus sp. MB-3u-03]PKG44740.1 excisionase [Planococcus sp. Urea-trap-24]PKG87083.1 excisionase [Planococcus sp. Urea-3u-39]PKH41138.1 excisionase [Planococcus sp. MB-3u-09]